jgi:crossover junction endodeoxyribonuclease RuvC
MTNILGIDPGLKGGWALMNDDGELMGCGRMPLTLLPRSKKGVDAAELYRLIRYASVGDLVDYVCIEQVHAMPKQGVSSSFTFGMGYGAVISVAQFLGGELFLSVPRVWKGHFGLAREKRASLAKAAELWPDELVDWSVLANDGIAEAALIAEYCRERLVPLTTIGKV